MATYTYDMIVYGATIHGLIFARRAASYGANVCVLEWSNHIGGTYTGGLGIGDWSTARWGYMKQIGQYIGSHAPYNYTDGTEIKNRSSIEAKAAVTAILLDSSNVTIVKNVRIKRVIPGTGNAVAKVLLENGDIYVALHSANDGSYEVDLAFHAGVPMRGGRDGASLYDEPVQFSDKGGLLSTPGFNPGHFTPENNRGYDTRGDRFRNQSQPPKPNMPTGGGSVVSQSYGWRFSLMLDTPGNSRPWVRPSGWSAADTKRIIDLTNNSKNFASPPAGSASGSAFPYGGSTQAVSGTVEGQPGRYSTNGCDLPGIYTNGWCEKTPDQRLKIQSRAAVEVMGSNWVWSQDTNISAVKRNLINRYLLPADEFTDDYIEFPGWPSAYYVRDGRSIIGQEFLTLKHLTPNPTGGAWNFSNSISTGGYPIDVHTPYLFNRPDGLVNKDGAIDYTVERDYGLPLGVFLPQASVCPNLSVSWGASMSTGFRASFRMEETVACAADALGVLHGLAWSTGRTLAQVPFAELKVALDGLGAVTTI